MPSPTGEYLALLADVRADPEDDTPRLVLADWLQDQGDPRGELLALALRRHRLAADDPERQALWRRERQLLARHAFDWLGPFLDLASHWTFERGFLHLEARADRFLTDALDALAEGPLLGWVERLVLLDVDSRHLTRLADSPVLGAIPRLALSDNRLGDDGFSRLLASPRLTGLRELQLARTRLSEWAVVALADCPHLERLRRLDLSGNGLRDGAGLALAHSPGLPGLRLLEVCGHCFTPATVEELSLRYGAVLRLWSSRN